MANKPTLRAGVIDALLRAARNTGKNRTNMDLPRNRGEARRYLRGKGPYMRYHWRRAADGYRFATRIRD